MDGDKCISYKLAGPTEAWWNQSDGDVVSIDLFWFVKERRKASFYIEYSFHIPIPVVFPNIQHFDKTHIWFLPQKQLRNKAQMPRTFSSEKGSSNFQLPDLGFLEVQRDLCRYGLGLAEATSHVEDRLLARAFPAQLWTRAESSYCGDLEVEKQLQERRNGQTWETMKPVRRYKTCAMGNILIKFGIVFPIESSRKGTS